MVIGQLTHETNRILYNQWSAWNSANSNFLWIISSHRLHTVQFWWLWNQPAIGLLLFDNIWPATLHHIKFTGWFTFCIDRKRCSFTHTLIQTETTDNDRFLCGRQHIDFNRLTWNRYTILEDIDFVQCRTDITSGGFVSVPLSIFTAKYTFIYFFISTIMFCGFVSFYTPMMILYSV